VEEELIAVWPMWQAMVMSRRLGVQIAAFTGVALAAAMLTAILAVDHPAKFWRHRIADISLMHGWVPATVQTISAVVLVGAIGWRTRRWRVLQVPLAFVLGVILAVWAHWGIGLTGLAAGIVVLGWRSARWRRRVVSVLAVPLCLLSAALAVNVWVGYFPTVHTAWTQLTAGPLPNQTDRATVTAMQLKGVMPAKGVVVPVNISADASKFKHRGELVYLPPAWFASTPPPRLPAMMMIGAEINTPADWLRAGNAVSTADAFAAARGGNAPVLVFADSGGAFGNDTECVNGSRGNAADHLTKDIVPFMISNFGVSPDPSHWGVAGFSTGGTCAVDLTVMHPDLFSVFIDISGDLGPNSGTKAQTVARLFGGNAAAWAAFDPTTVITRHGPYHGVSGWFAIAGADIGARDPGGQDAAANSLCALGRTKGIVCAVVAQPGKHDWSLAANAFAAALPWLAGRLGAPGVPQVRLPESTSAPVPSAYPSPATAALIATPSP
jgi:S-formylglutathione hydrolase FrmB